MRKMAANVLILAWVLLFPALALTQGTNKAPAKPAPSSLEDLLAKALQNNPDIRVAESKVREGDALLNRTRLEVMQKVVKLYHEVAAHKALVSQSQARLDKMIALMKNAAISREEIQIAEFALQQAKANLAKAEAEMPFLIGKQPADQALAFSPDGRFLIFQDHMGSRGWDPRTGKAVTLPGLQAEKIRAILNTPVQGEFTTEKLLKLFREKAKGINVHTQAFRELASPQTLHLTEPVPLGAALQWLEDTSNFRFVSRPYGIVLANRDQLPQRLPGDLLLNEWKNSPKKTTGKEP